MPIEHWGLRGCPSSCSVHADDDDNDDDNNNGMVTQIRRFASPPLVARAASKKPDQDCV